MNQLTPTSLETELALRDLKKQEGTTRTVPYISFFLTHLALVLFLLTTFSVDSWAGDNAKLPIKLTLATFALILIVAEFFYARWVGKRWQKNVLTLLEIQERREEEEARLRAHEEALALEQHKNHILMQERQRRHVANVIKEWNSQSPDSSQSGYPQKRLPQPSSQQGSSRKYIPAQNTPSQGFPFPSTHTPSQGIPFSPQHTPSQGIPFPPQKTPKPGFPQQGFSQFATEAPPPNSRAGE